MNNGELCREEQCSLENSRWWVVVYVLYYIACSTRDCWMFDGQTILLIIADTSLSSSCLFFQSWTGRNVEPFPIRCELFLTWYKLEWNEMKFAFERPKQVLRGSEHNVFSFVCLRIICLDCSALSPVRSSLQSAVAWERKEKSSF